MTKRIDEHEHFQSKSFASFYEYICSMNKYSYSMLNVIGASKKKGGAIYVTFKTHARNVSQGT